MKKAFMFLLLLILSAPVVSSQDSGFGINFHGFVKTDVIYDTRHTYDAREGHFLIFPKEEKLDDDGNDINGEPQFHILSIQTRLTGKITGPDVLGAKTSGVIEGAFFGTADEDINTFRLRHAFLKLDWKNSTLLIGQYWHPMFITKCFPDVVSFNTGAPFQPFSRNPQIRFVQKAGSVEFTIAALSQIDFRNTGPDGSSTKYLRDAGLPEGYLGIAVHAGDHLFGAGGGYKIIRPYIQYDFDDDPFTLNSFVIDETLGSYEAMGYARLNFGDFSAKVEGVYGQNLTNLTMLGGYTAYMPDPEKDELTYSPFNTLSLWGELMYGKDVQVGLFAGYSQNLGISDDIEASNGLRTSFYARGHNIDKLIRVSPRVVWNIEKVRFAFELEYTSADYGSPDFDDKLKVTDTYTVENIRALFAAYLFF